MAAHSDSRPSSSGTPLTHPSRQDGRSTWSPYERTPELQLQEVEQDAGEREAIPPPMSTAPSQRATHADGQGASSVSSSQTNEMLEALSTLTDKVKDGVTRDAIVETVKKFAKSMQQTVSKLGGVAGADRREERTSDVAIGRFSMPSRNSLSNSLDGYRPDRDVVAPISVRPNAMELLWVCGDCGQHYPRARECPEECNCCGAPKQHFYAPIED